MSAPVWWQVRKHPAWKGGARSKGFTQTRPISSLIDSERDVSIQLYRTCFSGNVISGVLSFVKI